MDNLETSWSEAAFKRRASLARAFYCTWRRLARLGQCDAIDGMECNRVYSEWVAAGRPLNIVTFIRERANAH